MDESEKNLSAEFERLPKVSKEDVLDKLAEDLKEIGATDEAAGNIRALFASLLNLPADDMAALMDIGEAHKVGLPIDTIEQPDGSIKIGPKLM